MIPLNYSKKTRPTIANTITHFGHHQKKRSGFGGFLTGLLFIVILISLALGGGLFYLYKTNQNETLGMIAYYYVRSDSFKKNIMQETQNNNLLPVDEKIAFDLTYTQLITSYSLLTPDNKKAVNLNLGLLARKYVWDQSLFKNKPLPQEIQQLFAVLIPDKIAL